MYLSYVKYFSKYVKKNGIKHSKTCAYNPKCNGLVERCHRDLKRAINALKDRVEGRPATFETLGTVGAARRKKISKSPGQMSLSDIDATGGIDYHTTSADAGAMRCTRHHGKDEHGYRCMRHRLLH